MADSQCIRPGRGGARPGAGRKPKPGTSVVCACGGPKGRNSYQCRRCSAIAKCQGPKVSNCRVCGAVFEHARRLPLRCCSDGCRHVAMRRAAERSNRGRTQRIVACGICGKLFHPAGSRAGFCSRPCGFEHQRQECARKSSALRTARDAAKRVDRERRCAQCGAAFTATRANQALCPDTECRLRYHAAAYAKGADAYRERNRAKYVRRAPSAFMCQGCGAEFLGKKGRKWCAACPPNGAGRHRAKRFGVPYDITITSGAIFERDGWRCMLCGVPTRKELRGHQSHPLAPTEDHIIPLSVPGSPGHVWANVQCAHRKCNCAKRDRIIGQLRLV